MASPRRRIDHRLDQSAQRLDQAARVKPNLDEHIATQLAYCDTRQANETGISSPGTISDPTIARVMARADVMGRSNAIEAAVVAVERAIDQLDDALRAGWGRDRPAPPAIDEPTCTGGDPSTWGDPQCGDIVESEERNYGVWYHRSGLCPKHRKRKERWERESAA
jgi:hypothetical protein